MFWTMYGKNVNNAKRKLINHGTSRDTRRMKYGEKWKYCLEKMTMIHDDALPLGRVNEARFKAMIRKELEDNKYIHEMS
ncbi:hypothetical protein Tco_0012887 [Tanacetum coccineum]